MSTSAIRVKLSRAALQDVGIEGALMALSPLSFMLTTLNTGNDFPCFEYLNIGNSYYSLVESDSGINFFIGSAHFFYSHLFYFTIATMAAILSLISAFLILRHPMIGKIAAALALAGNVFIAIPYLITNPFAAFIGATFLISAGFYLLDFKPAGFYSLDLKASKSMYDQVSSPQKRALQRVRYGIITVSLLAIFRFAMNTTSDTKQLQDGTLALSALIVQVILIHFAWKLKQNKILHSVIWGVFCIISVTAIISALYIGYNISIIIFISSLITISILPSPSKTIHHRYDQWWEMFLNHPARMMLTTFMLLCTTGTILLILPVSATNDAINFVDAAFTSVSAVCVTGLIVLDTPNDFSLAGQIFILILIQLGGLGIMSITTVGMHAMGRRLTLRQERLLTTMTDTDHKDLIRSLVTILKFTFIAESIGALALSSLFYYQTGDTLKEALWRGGFTAISAFCNAGFALQSDNLVSYQQNPLILHTVAALIIFGGIAPATTLLIPRWLTGKNIPVAPYIALNTTAILLVSGTLFFLVFEWNDVLSQLPVADKIHNAWFQSVTLRTAGFNSVDIAGVASPIMLLMICLMFIGGSPGGTAGGIKTTTIGILVLTFWTNITNNKSVVILNRRIQSRVIYRAITIFMSGAVTWIIIVLMLEVTQQIPTSEIIFEATSAMGTVGLSIGATSHLDEIGKIIIMLAMFTGRIGPITIFMLLSDERNDNPSRYQNAKISLT